MNCPAWEERILQQLEGVTDEEAAAHLRDCPACAGFARELADDARILQMPPPELAVVDYAAIRASARREAAGGPGGADCSPPWRWRRPFC
jgi:hypothetical protein